MALSSVILLAALPSAVAGGTLDAGVLVVQVEDQRRDCTIPAAGFCAFDYSHDGTPGTLVVDTYQEIQYVGIATDFPLLPDQSLTLRGNGIYVPNPVTPAATEAWNDLKPEDYPGSDTVWIVMTSDESAIYYHGPWVRDPMAPWEAHGFGVAYVDGEAYDQFGPYNAPGSGDGQTDYLPAGIPLFCTFPQVNGPCVEITHSVNTAWEETSPNVKVGYQFWDFQVATDPNELTPPNRLDSSHHAEEHRFVKGDPALPVLGRRAPNPPEPLSDEAPSSPQPAPHQPERAASRPLPLTPPMEIEGENAPPQDDLLLPIVAAASAATVVFILIALYSRLLRGHVLVNPTRKRVYELIQAYPGIGVVQLATELNVRENAVEHHIALLKTHNLVIERKPGKVRCYFSIEAIPEDEQLSAEVVLRDAVRRRLAELVLRGATTTPLLVAQTGLGRRLIAYHLTRLEEKDLVISGGVRPKQYLPTQKLRHLMGAT